MAAGSETQEYLVSYPPSKPKWSHPLGTTSQGDDVVAYLYGGLQVNFQAAIIYIPIVYLIGVTVGLLMGYFGGWFDLVVQRVIEILSNIPFLFLVIILCGYFFLNSNIFFLSFSQIIFTLEPL